ncbi:hypothetical protein NE865_15029 [Phthorimaea operculella]|nr:hypothetical protein NE865_15029 [Phthorimaea operculella]
MTEELKKQLNKLVGQRGAVKGKFTRLTSYLEQINIQNKDIDEIRVRYEELPNQLKEFEYIQEQIEELDPTNPTHDAERDKIENKYYSLRAALNKHLQEAKHKFTHNHKDTSVRLPKIELPTFSGEIREWPSFKNLFECAMPSELSKIQKLQYLKSCLRGEAATLISNMLLTDENYDKAIETLVNRYENKSIVVNYHLKNFLNYATITRNNIKEFTTVLQQSLDSLTALELPVTQWDVLLVYLITQKMDNSLRAAWELNRKETSIPTLQELKEFFKLRATAFEMINDRQESKLTLKQTPKVVHAITNLDVQCKMCRAIRAKA